jgi:hypothetical protein
LSNTKTAWLPFKKTISLLPRLYIINISMILIWCLYWKNPMTDTRDGHCPWLSDLDIRTGMCTGSFARKNTSGRCYNVLRVSLLVKSSRLWLILELCICTHIYGQLVRTEVILSDKLYFVIWCDPVRVYSSRSAENYAVSSISV